MYGTKMAERYQDAVFNEAGGVRLPRLTGMALTMAVNHGGPLTNQPTEQRARAVMQAVTPRAESKGLRLALRQTGSGRWIVSVFSV